MYLAYLGVDDPAAEAALRGLAGQSRRTPRRGCSRSAPGGSRSTSSGSSTAPSMVINLEWPRIALYVDDTYKWGPIVGDARPGRRSGSSTTTPCSGTRAGCSRSIAPRLRRATDLRGVGGRVPAHPAAPHGRSASRTRPARRQGDPGRHRARVHRRRARRARPLHERARSAAWAPAIGPCRAGQLHRRLARRPALDARAPARARAGCRGGHPGRAGRLCRLRRVGGVPRAPCSPRCS